MLISSQKLLQKARKEHFAVPAFNVNNLEMVEAVMKAALELKSPVILQTSEGAIEYAGMNYLIALARIAAEAKLPVVLHLDHGKNLATIKEAIKQGYSSVMIDASRLPLKENIATTKKVVAWAKAKKVSVEAEIGAIRGVEDHVSVAEAQAFLTDPEEAAFFAKETGCDSLAISIGTAHGAYKFEGLPRLELNRLKQIATLVKIPLVLHGASGVREDLIDLAEHHGAKIGAARGVLDKDIKAAIKLGITKVNIDTDLRLAFTAGIREAIDELPKVIDPRKFLGPASLLMTEVARQKIALFGSARKG
jgi:fructose-bisphosphate aldolase class II